MDSSQGQGARPPWASSPTLSRGAHLTAGDGVCLMEAVSLAARLPWSDAPACTHPLLGHLARLVNDACSDEARQHLAVLVPGLRSAAPGDQAAAARVSARIAVACAALALELRPTVLVRHLHRSAVAELRREAVAMEPGSTGGTGQGTGTRMLRRRIVHERRRLFERGPGARAVEAAVASCLHEAGPDRDAALLLLMRNGLAAAHMEASPVLAVPAHR